MSWSQRCALIPLCLIALLCSASADDYPTRNVTILVPFAPGGGTDLIARTVAQKLEGRLGKSFIIENRPGAGTTIAAGETAQGRSRRLYADAGDQRHDVDESHHLQETTLHAG